MFEPERFVADCVKANADGDPQRAVLEVLEQAISDPGAVLRGVGEPVRAGLNVLHRSPTLTIFAASWTPRMNLMPHEHRMWALIGIYTGREDNLLWRHGADGRLGAIGAKALFEGQAVSLPVDAIHSVTNPLLRFTGGLHVYGGDFFATERRQWNAESLVEEISDGETIRAIFEAENARLA
jgi:predicted metal-dependent enzyme (double-stranded beta helix superfamily)